MNKYYNFGLLKKEDFLEGKEKEEYLKKIKNTKDITKEPFNPFLIVKKPRTEQENPINTIIPQQNVPNQTENNQIFNPFNLNLEGLCQKLMLMGISGDGDDSIMDIESNLSFSIDLNKCINLYKRKVPCPICSIPMEHLKMHICSCHSKLSSLCLINYYNKKIEKNEKIISCIKVCFSLLTQRTNNGNLMLSDAQIQDLSALYHDFIDVFLSY